MGASERGRWKLAIVRGLRPMTHSPSSRLVVQRLVSLVPVLFGVTFLSAALLNVLPGDTAAELLGTSATPHSVHELTIKLHLNRPFLVRYWDWLLGVLHGHLGRSITSGLSVGSLLWEHMPVTLELLLYAFVVALLASVPFAVVAARRPAGLGDRAITVVAMAGLSLAPFVLGLLLVLLFADIVPIFPALGWTSVTSSLGSNLWYLTMPAFSLGFPLACFYTRMLKADIVDQMLREEYIVAARARGLGNFSVLVRHALRNSLLGLITLVGLNVGNLIGGTVLIESIFSLPGIGAQLLTAIGDRDVPLVEGTVLVLAVVVVLANLVTDVLLGVLDPRIRHGRSLN